MTLGGCSRENEVAGALSRGHWPSGAGDELRAHVASCRACQDLVLVRQAFAADRLAVSGAARLESPGVVWWRAQLRRRNAAIERIGRPIIGAQIFALAVGLAALIAFLALQVRSGFAWLAWIQELPRALHLEELLPDSVQKFPGGAWLVVSLATMLALMSGVIVYVKSEKR